MSDRPTFYYQDKPVRACGILFYRYFNYRNNTKVPKFLMIHNGYTKKYGEHYEDFGGKTDNLDKSIQDTVIREAYEESNGVLKKYLNKKVLKKGKIYYYTKGKYLFYLVELKDYISPKLFGDKELHDDIYRTVEWVSYTKFNKLLYNDQPNISPRLRSRQFLTDIKSL